MIPWNVQTASLNRSFRFAVARSQGDKFGILISTSTVVSSAETFLQLIAWDPQKEVYNYYERRGRTWVWAGNSWYAFHPDSRGKGPFDSHVNGSLVMKELKVPWNHWHSESSSITEEALAPDDVLRAEPLFLNRRGRQELQVGIVQPGIDRWTEVRVRKSIENGTSQKAGRVRY